MNQRSKTQGFTLIELMLAMTFIAILLVTIALTVIQMSVIYTRGMTIKEVNQAARDISDDLRRTVQSAGVFEVSPTGADTTDMVAVKNTGGAVVGGRVCTGVASYIWNTAKADSSTKSYISSNPAGTNGAEFNFVKVPDVGKKYCAKDSKGALVHSNILYADRGVAKELLKPGDRTIRMLEFTVQTTDDAYDALSGQRLYTVSYRLGTGDTSAMNTAHTQCLLPGEENSNIDYCNIQQFSIVLRAGNAVN